MQGPRVRRTTEEKEKVESASLVKEEARTEEDREEVIVKESDCAAHSDKIEGVKAEDEEIKSEDSKLQESLGNKSEEVKTESEPLPSEPSEVKSEVKVETSGGSSSATGSVKKEPAAAAAAAFPAPLPGKPGQAKLEKLAAVERDEERDGRQRNR